MENDNGKVYYVADNKCHNRMAFHRVVLLFTQFSRYQIVFHLWFVRHATSIFVSWLSTCVYILEVPGSISQ